MSESSMQFYVSDVLGRYEKLAAAKQTKKDCGSFKGLAMELQEMAAVLTPADHAALAGNKDLTSEQMENLHTLWVLVRGLQTVVEGIENGKKYRYDEKIKVSLQIKKGIKEMSKESPEEYIATKIKTYKKLAKENGDQGALPSLVAALEKNAAELTAEDFSYARIGGTVVHDDGANLREIYLIIKVLPVVLKMDEMAAKRRNEK